MFLFFFLQVLEAFSQAEKKKKPSPNLLFTDVYDQMTPQLEKQLKEMKDHVTNYKEQYPIDQYEKFWT